jgi:hypothetical protein
MKCNLDERLREEMYFKWKREELSEQRHYRTNSLGIINM